MSESDEHRMLVQMMAQKLISENSQISVNADLPEFSRPSKISGFIPDVFGLHHRTNQAYVCEAKTWHDLQSDRSYNQIISFIEHVNREPKGLFILGGLPNTARRAKTILCFMVKNEGFAEGTIQVFDGLDYWKLDKKEDFKWVLL